MAKNKEMPLRWERCIMALLTNTDAIAPFSLAEARRHFGVGADFISALKSLGVIRFFERGRYKFPYMIGDPTAEEIREQIAKDRQVTHHSLAEAIEIITAAGGTVVFGDAKEQINKAHAAKNMEAMARKRK